MPTTELDIHTADNRALRSTLYTPPHGQEVKAAIVLNAATGVRRKFYGRFAAFLAESRGFAVLTYDYRGIADSSPENFRAFPARIRDWPLLDVPAAIERLKYEWPSKKLFLIGHSAGGNLLGLVPVIQRIDAVLLVGAQFGYWKLWPRRIRYLMATVWYFVVPASSAIFGYVPRWLGAGQRWPRRIALELARWCRDPEYLFGDPSLDTSGYHSFDKSMLAYSFEDDPHACQPACTSLLARFSQARIEHRHLAPHELNLDNIGHFGFFRPQCEPLWNECADWFSAQLVLSNHDEILSRCPIHR